MWDRASEANAISRSMPMEQEQNQRRMRDVYKINFSLYLIFLQKGWVAYPKSFKIQNIIFLF